MEQQQERLIAAAIRRLEMLQKTDAFDPINLDSRPTPAQAEVITDFGSIKTQWIVAATQSGKSQTCSRLVSWVLTESHPSWKRPKEWNEEPLLIIVAGRTGKQIEESLLPKLESYMKPGTYKVVRIGNIVQRLEHENGNRIVFQSLENPNMARERIQSYVAHLVWVDEMPPTAFIVDELMRRVQARSGYFLASFTPLVVNDTIKRMVDAAAMPYSKKYKFTMFDNPLYASDEKKAEILASMAGMPESVRNTRLFGEWSANDDSVYYFDYESMVEMPEGYSPYWRHVESVDPATQSALGLTVWAENPNNGSWYCVLAEYVKGIYIPTEIVKHVQQRTKNYNIIRRISDSEATWFIHQASALGVSYSPVFKKNGRKIELIKQLQELLGSRRVRVSPTCEHLISEFQECRWSDRSEGRIINSSSYHLLDSAQYFCDNIPKGEKKGPELTLDMWYVNLLKANQKRLQIEEKKSTPPKMSIKRKGTRWR